MVARGPGLRLITIIRIFLTSGFITSNEWEILVHESSIFRRQVIDHEINKTTGCCLAM